MKDVLKTIEKWGFKLDQMDVLETFGGYGEFHLDQYAPLVKSIQIWEVRPDRVEFLEKKYPGAVKWVDSYEEIKVTPDKFDMVMIDPVIDQQSTAMLPDVLRVLKNKSVLVLSVEARNLNRARRTMRELGAEEIFTKVNRKNSLTSYHYLACLLNGKSKKEAI